jgi:molybdenum cofactor cytidylyltransferase
MSVCGIVLAAGRGVRMGGTPKQLLPLDGRPLLQHAVDAAAAAGLQDIVVVLGHEADRIAPALHLPPGARVVVNPRHEEGQATSLSVALGAMPPGATAALVLLGDQPEVRAEALRAVIAAAGDAPVVRASYGGVPGHPVLLARSLWPELARGRGDAGARGLIAARGERPALVEVGGSAPADIDTPDDYARLRARHPAAPGEGGGTDATVS